MSEDTNGNPEARLKLGDTLLTFWTARDEWPRDSHQHVFLARVVDLVGRAHFGDEWIALIDPTNLEAKTQRTAVFEELAHALGKGDLTTFTRAREGGGFKSITPDIWHTERFRARFKYCLVNRSSPFDDSDDDEDGSYIYLDRVQVEAFIRSRPNRNLRIDDADALPTFLAVLVRTATALEIHANSPTLPAKTIKKKFAELARQAGIADDHVSDHVLRYAATFLRPPGAGRTAQDKNL